ncbi:MAG: hypothetical protein AAF086_03505 [Planctomycetota bacterium]
MESQDYLNKALYRRYGSIATTSSFIRGAEYASDLPPNTRYAILSMQPMKLEHTEKSLTEGARVRNHLEKEFPDGFTYRFQGSVINATDIKSHSDIDLLCITTTFTYMAPGHKATFPWDGNAAQHLKERRGKAKAKLDSSFPKAKVIEGNKSLAIEGGTLVRKVDVVPSAWEDTQQYLDTKSETYRAIRILDSSGNGHEGWGDLHSNTPFLHNHRIDEKDEATGGSLRKAARLMKSLKYDTSIDISSYDIVSIAYSIDKMKLLEKSISQIEIVQLCRDHCECLIKNRTLRENLKVPDESRNIFSPAGPTTLSALEQLHSELKKLASKIDIELTTNIRSAAMKHFENTHSSRPNYEILNNRSIL